MYVVLLCTHQSACPKSGPTSSSSQALSAELPPASRAKEGLEGWPAKMGAAKMGAAKKFTRKGMATKGAGAGA